MAQRITLRYFPGDSPLHRWDARCKLLGLLMITATLLYSKLNWLFFDSTVLIGLLILSQLPLRQLLRDLRIWVIFLFSLFLFHAFFTQGARLSTLSWLPISQEGIRLGFSTSWRLGLILGFSILFTAVTRPRELQDALIYFLTPVPLIPKRRIGLMVSLTLRFFSIILDQAEEVHLAHKARLGDRNKNPFRKAKFLVFPILSHSIFRAEEVTYALFARGYREDLPLKGRGIPFPHIIPLLFFFGILLVFWWVN